MPTSRATRYGPPALRALAETVRSAKADEPLAPVTVVVPNNHVGVTARRALARGAGGPLTGSPHSLGSIAVTFLTVFRLAELLGATRLAGRNRWPVATAVVGAAMRSALRDEPGIFAGVASHPATEQALVATYRELSELPTDALDRLAGAGDRARDTVRLARTVRSSLGARWYDEQDLVAAALQELDSADHSELGHVVVYLPQDLTRNQARLLRGVGEQHPVTVVAGLTGSPAADEVVHRALRSLAAPDVTLPRGDEGFLWPVDAGRTGIVTTTDADEEVRTAVGAIVDAARAGTALERIAVLYPVDEPYARLLHEHLSAADVPTNGPTARPLADHAYGRTLLKLLHLPSTGYRRAEVLDLLTSVPLRSPSGNALPTADWERLSRDAGVVGGRDHWDSRLDTLADRFERAARELPGDETSTPTDPATATESPAAVAESGAGLNPHLHRADRARHLRRYALDLIDTLEDAAAGSRPWHERVAWLRRAATHLLGSETDRHDWPADEVRAAARVEAALDRLALLDSLDEPCSLDQFARTLELELDEDLGRHGRFGEGVLVAPLGFGVGLDLDLVVVVGLADGSLPAQPNDDALLPDAERALADGALRLRRDHPHRQRRQLLAALASSHRHLLTTPRGDLRASSFRTPSHWLDEFLTPATPLPTEPPLRTPRVEEQPSFAHRVTRTPSPASAQELRLRHPHRLDDPATTAGQDVLISRGGTGFTRYDGNLIHALGRAAGGGATLAPTDDIISTTRLETWARCPHAYFVRYLLGVVPVEDPDEQFTISPRDKGALVHEVLDTFISETLDHASPPGSGPGPGRATGSLTPTGDRSTEVAPRWTDADRARLRDVASEICDRYEAAGRTGHPLFWEHERAKLLTLFDRFLAADDLHRRQTGLRPMASELGFGGDEGPGPVSLPLTDGRTLNIRGVIDRVDHSPDGHVLVVDYKTGRPVSQRQFDTDPHDRGTRLQLPVYALAARQAVPPEREVPDRPVRAEYWHLDHATGFVRRGFDVTDDLLADVSRTVTTVVDGIGTGLFPARPTDVSTSPFPSCHYCDPDGLGAQDRLRAWERKRHHPALADYRTLAEPDLETGTGGSGARPDRVAEPTT